MLNIMQKFKFDLLENQFWADGVYNLGQKVADKLTKLSKIGYSKECIRADFLPFFTKKIGF